MGGSYDTQMLFNDSLSNYSNLMYGKETHTVHTVCKTHDSPCTALIAQHVTPLVCQATSSTMCKKETTSPFRHQRDLRITYEPALTGLLGTHQYFIMQRLSYAC